MPDPQAVVFGLIYGRWRSQALYAGAQLRIFDAIAEEPRSSGSIAEELELDPDALYRLLRALASLGRLQEREQRTFSITEAGRLLRGDDPHSLRDMALLTKGPEHYAIWKHLRRSSAKVRPMASSASSASRHLNMPRICRATSRPSTGT